MDLFSKIQHDMSEGIYVLRKEGTSLFIKTMAEMDMVKCRLDIYKIHNRLSGLYKELGERFMEALNKKDYNFLTKDEVKGIIEMIDNIRIEDDRYRREMDNLKELQKRGD